MTPRYHMQDQVHDRIKDLMGENQTFTWCGGRLQNFAAPAIIVLFFAPGLKLVRNMRKITFTISRLCGGSVTRLTGRREYIRVGLTAAIPAADTCQSSHRPPF